MAKHNFLVIGSGGREHALAWKLAQSELTENVYCCPGNGGTDTDNKIINAQVDWQDFVAVAKFVHENDVDATIVGPEAPLVAGLSDYLTQQGHYTFGPSATGAQLEGSKSFCKNFLLRHDIATAGYQEFYSYDAALDYIRQGSSSRPFPRVIKFDGLAGGKGVTIARDIAEASDALADIYKHNKFGQPTMEQGHLVIVEEFLVGQEISCMIAVQGGDFSIMQTSRDHKPRDDGNLGPNTGGMGAYTPALLSVATQPSELSDELLANIKDKVVVPTVEGMIADGIDYCGFLYAGLITDGKQVKVLEYNCRLGDPETEPLMFALKSDLAEFFLSAKEGAIPDKFVWHPGCALSVVMASSGYPHGYKTGMVINGLQNDGKGGDEGESGNGLKVFHCGTANSRTRKQLLTAGGRVLAVTARGKDIDTAYDLAYERVGKINWQGCYYRKDIGKI